MKSFFKNKVLMSFIITLSVISIIFLFILSPPSSNPDIPINTLDPSGQIDEDTSLMADESEILSSKLFQKNLAPFSFKEKVKWSFKLSRKNIFL